MSIYKLGTTDPIVQFDKGAGPWNSITPLPSQVDKSNRFILLIHVKLIDNWLKRYFAPDAVKNLEHFLDNSGTTLEFSEDGFMNSTYCKRLYDNEVRDAKAFCETLSPGRYEIVSASATLGDAEKKGNLSWFGRMRPGNQNIFYSLGGFRFWGKATVEISRLGKADIIYYMNFTFSLIDRYNWNWNPNSNVTQGTLVGDETWNDADFALLNLFGFAQDFDIKGAYTHKFIWRKNEYIERLHYPIPLRDYF